VRRCRLSVDNVFTHCQQSVIVVLFARVLFVGCSRFFRATIAHRHFDVVLVVNALRLSFNWLRCIASHCAYVDRKMRQLPSIDHSHCAQLINILIDTRHESYSSCSLNRYLIDTHAFPVDAVRLSTMTSMTSVVSNPSMTISSPDC
jgi:hypothetical protein